MSDLSGLEGAIGQGHVAVVSFDVFDTLLYRKVASPDGVHAATAAALDVDPGLFCQYRRIAEYTARKAASGREATIREIYAAFPVGRFGWGAEKRAELVEAEFAAELALCFANADMLAIARSCKAAGARIGVLSDTYWGDGLLARLLAARCPGLDLDFIYASSDHRASKAGGLFRQVKADLRLADATSWMHWGDNPAADVTAAEKIGIRAVHFPQGAPLHQRLREREVRLTRLSPFGAQDAALVDGGMEILRRIASHEEAFDDPFHAVGASVLGPVLTAFIHDVARRFAALRASNPEARIAFLARDGFLPYRLWRAEGMPEAAYVDLNRRVTLIGASADVGRIADFLSRLDKVMLPGLESFLGLRSPALEAYFSACPDGVADAAELAEALPSLLGGRDLYASAALVRRQIVMHLENRIADFASCGDLMLVDIGYTGTVQKSLRQVLDLEGISTRLHGVYLLPSDEDLQELAPGDSAGGLIDDRITPPSLKRCLLRNVAVLEQLMSEPVGSVREYRGGEPVREAEVRSSHQLRLCLRAHEGALSFSQLAALQRAAGLDPFADLEGATRAAALVLTRFLLWPLPEEVEAFCRLDHDINLGTAGHVSLVDGAAIAALGAVHQQSALFTAQEPPMWLAASLALADPQLCFAYLLWCHGAGGEVAVGEELVGDMMATLFRGQEGAQISVPLQRLANGDYRVRLPVSARYRGDVAALLIGDIASGGFVRSFAFQSGPGAVAAMKAPPRLIDLSLMRGLGLDIAGGVFRCLGPEAHLLLPVPAGDDTAVLTLTFACLPPGEAATSEPARKGKDAYA
jgi:FMN phosphatase YigB (HAD superfamily)